MVDLFLVRKIGAHLDPETKMLKDLFKRDHFVNYIMCFYERVMGEQVEEGTFSLKKDTKSS